ncbi:MAG: DNA mismatch repair protein MutS [Candidatus Gastranaerophilales bacterium]|nr:DNA mismatch repair protein MutS [Candidatus Gastranaerophilales bacterium]
MEYQSFIKSAEVDITKASKSLKQYLTIKRQNPDSIIFFRLGDFYETYFEDAEVLSKVCGVLLTKRKFTELGNVLMAGVPHTSADIYIGKLTNDKYKVSIVEQVQKKEDVKKGDIIKREVIRTYSPGTLIDESFLNSKENNFLASVLKDPKGNNKYGFSYADISTGEFFITEGNLDEILCELSKINPSELLLKLKPREIEPFRPVPEKEADIDEAVSKKYPNTIVSKEFYSLEFKDDSLLEYELGLKCANSIINYVKETQKSFMPKLDIIRKYGISSHLIMNERTRENLELNRNSHDKKKYGSVFWALDRCKTSMGKRLLASFLNEPLYNIDEIEKRLDGVEELISDRKSAEKLAELLEDLADISRLSSKLSNGTISPKELLAIKSSLKITEKFNKLSDSFKSPILKNAPETEVLEGYREIIERTIADEPSNNIRVGGIIKDGANGALDVLRAEIAVVENEILEYENELILQTGVKNLKINYAKNTGYTADIPILSSKAFRDNVSDCIMRQKTASFEKFTTSKLSNFEEKILSLKLKSYELEFDTYSKLREYSKELTEPLREFSADVALKDVLLSFANVASDGAYTRPKFTNCNELNIKNGVHPVLTALLSKQNVAIDALSAEFRLDNKIKILTGANMIGKSTYLRQLAAITIMAQAGSFVPCEDYKGALTDKIYARMGSFDDMLQNNSAFMCEMLDVAEILRNSTSKSLILLDETGVSTSYKDGISISYGIIKYISEKIGAKTVLATHFQELGILEKEAKNIKNYRLVMDNENENPKRRLELGVCTESLGFDAAKKAFLPPLVLTRAQEFRQKFE